MLEPRVLLSGNALATVAARQVEIPTDSVSAESATESTPPACQNVAYDPAAAVNDIFGDTGAQASAGASPASQPTTAPPPDSQNGQTAAPASEASVQSSEPAQPGASG